MKIGQRVVDAGDHADLTEQVEVAGEPRPPRTRSSAPAWPTSSTGRRRSGSRADLAHCHSDQQGEEADDDPPEGDDTWSTGSHAEPVARHAAGKDRDDREADGEVAEPAELSVQLLRIAHCVRSSRSESTVVIQNPQSWPGVAPATHRTRAMSSTCESGHRANVQRRGSDCRITAMPARILRTRGADLGMVGPT